MGDSAATRKQRSVHPLVKFIYPALTLAMAMTFVVQGSPGAIAVGVVLALASLRFAWKVLENPDHCKPDWSALDAQNSKPDERKIP